MEVSDIPQPADLRVSQEALRHEESELAVEDVPQDIPEGVDEVAPDAVEQVRAAPALRSNLTQIVSIRAMVSKDSAPRIGDFDFHHTVGRDAQTGKTAKGVYRQNFIYRVPRYVAEYMQENNWAIMIG